MSTSKDDQISQLEVQLAGCGVAALGHTDDVAKPGDYGWSASYEDTLKLRRRFDALYKALSASYDKDEIPLSLREVLQAVRADMRTDYSAAKRASAFFLPK